MTTLTSLPPDSELLRLQTDFTRYLRNPDLEPIPDGLDPRRINIYSELIFNNISNLMSEFYPVIRSLMSDPDWHDLIREFFINYRAETPYFPELADEFLEFLSGRKGANDTPDYLVPLAHYEWLELCLFLSESQLPDKPLGNQALESRSLRLTDLAIPVFYEYPVHQIKREWQEQANPTQLLVFRDKTDSVRFFEIQPLAYELLTEMQSDAGVQITRWLEAKAKVLNQDPTSFVKFGLDLVQQFNQERLFL